MIYVILGVDKEGYREIFDFFVGAARKRIWMAGDSSIALQKRRTRWGVFDCLSWLEKAFQTVYPKADVQRCVVHRVRKTLHCIRRKDQLEVAEELKLIFYLHRNKEIVIQMFQQFESKWSSKYPRENKSWGNELDVILTLMDYPSSIPSVIYSTNAIKCTIKEIRNN